jgi:uncharacterized protein (DUF433 family)
MKNEIQYLKAGDPLEAFLDDFPTVTHQQAVAYLDQTCSWLT